jgi:putative oxidoreductase
VFKLLLKTNEDVAPMILRVLLAVVIFPHGAQKVLGIWGGQGLSATYDMFRHLGIGGFWATLDILAEFAGPLALAVGLLVRPAALGIAVMISVAALAVHVANGFFMNWTGTQQGEGFEYHILVLAISLALILQGAGKWSLDSWISAKTSARQPSSDQKS